VGLLYPREAIIKRSNFTYFFLPEPPDETATITIGGEEARHILKVCRHKTGDQICAIDGSGPVYNLVILSTESDRVFCKVVSMRNSITPRFTCDLAIPLGASQRLDIAIEKCTELGIGRFLLYHSAETARETLSDSKRARMERLIRAATKQSLRSRVASLNHIPDIQSLVARFADYETVLLGDHSSDHRTIEEAIDTSGSGRVLIVVGPESGLRENEIAEIVGGGAVPVVIGETRLRFETACISLASIVIDKLVRATANGA